MTKHFACFALLLFFTTALSQNRFLGKWKTIDDETGKPVSVVEIFESKGRIYGKIVELYNPKNVHRKCENCTGDDKNKPLLGLIVIKGLTKDGNEYSNGKILDPKQGKLYKCTISLDGNDRLKVRGFIGVSLIGRTQVWERLKT
jgi:uncharacterized protein (DUF2147 family)